MIVLDALHSQVGGNEEAPAYRLEPCESLVIDFGDFVFEMWESEEEPPPDTIALMIGERRQYYFHFEPGERRHTLDRSTLLPRGGCEPWTGLRGGDRAILGVGRLRIDQAKGEEVFRVHWVGLVEVEAGKVE